MNTNFSLTIDEDTEGGRSICDVQVDDRDMYPEDVAVTIVSQEPDTPVLFVLNGTVLYTNGNGDADTLTSLEYVLKFRYMSLKYRYTISNAYTTDSKLSFLTNKSEAFICQLGFFLSHSLIYSV